ncbi:MAG: ABC transporter permease [Hungatella sp.]|nr:ABC transporter permease [Hungatella sp.]
MILEFFRSPSFWYSVLSSTTPVMLATLAANIATKSGVFNLAIEGTMLICALAGVLGSAFFHNLLAGVFFGIVFGVTVSCLLGYFALVMKGPMNSCGVAVNLLAAGGTVFVLDTVTGSKITSSSLISMSFPQIDIPFIRSIPVFGQILSSHNLVTYLGWIFAILTWLMLYKTKLGRNIRAVGENEEAAKSAGISILGMKFISLALCGTFCAFGGMYLSMGSLNSFTAGMVSGRGYLALAMDAMSSGNPLVGFVSSLLYGFSNTITVYLQLYSNLDLKLINAFPYLFIIGVLLILQFFKNHIMRRSKKLAASTIKY